MFVHGSHVLYFCAFFFFFTFGGDMIGPASSPAGILRGDMIIGDEVAVDVVGVGVVGKS